MEKKKEKTTQQLTLMQNRLNNSNASAEHNHTSITGHIQESSCLLLFTVLQILNLVQNDKWGDVYLVRKYCNTKRIRSLAYTD